MTRTSPHLLTPLLPLLLAACGDAGAGGADGLATATACGSLSDPPGLAGVAASSE